MSFDSDYLWLEGDFVPFEDAKVHFLTSSLHYGTGIFEGIRSYTTPNGPAVFRLKDHIDRFFKSAKILGYRDLPYSKETIVEACLELIRRNGFEECYIRPLIYIKGGGWNLVVDDVEVEMGIAAWKWGNYLGEDALKYGIRANIATNSRLHPNITMTKGKIAGNYVNSVLAKTESLRAGFDEAILLDPSGTVAEGTGENIFVVEDGVIYTPPREMILEGLTRDSIIAIAHDIGYTVKEEKISRDQLYIADEVFVTGTAAEVVALSEIDHRSIGDGTMGPICAKLQKIYHEAVRGRLDGYSRWLDYVHDNQSTIQKGT
tara:strand:- start:8391 stop:9341 length:951 start_codon:yes stop_codon:yes gene_type:complete